MVLSSRVGVRWIDKLRQWGQHGPVHVTAYERMRGFRDRFLDQKKPLRILDLGSCSHAQDLSHRNLFDQPPWSYTGVDLVAGPNVDIVLEDPYIWSELGDESVDVLVSGQVFEHIEFPWLTMLEIARVLKPGGMACIIVPSAGRIHRAPVDCWRFHPDGLTALAKHVHMQVLLAAEEWQPPHAQLPRNGWRDAILVTQKVSASRLLDERMKHAHQALIALRDLPRPSAIAADVRTEFDVLQRALLSAELNWASYRREARMRGKKWLKRTWKRLEQRF